MKLTQWKSMKVYISLVYKILAYGLPTFYFKLFTYQKNILESLHNKIPNNRSVQITIYITTETVLVYLLTVNYRVYPFAMIFYVANIRQIYEKVTIFLFVFISWFIIFIICRPLLIKASAIHVQQFVLTRNKKKA